MFDALNVKATQTGFAKLVGISQPAISQRIKNGKLPEKGTMIEWLQIYIEDLRSEASGRADTSAQDVRKRKELAQARREELELSKDLKLVINLDDLEPALIGLMKEILSSTMEAGNKILQSIETQHSVQLDDDTVYGPLRAALGNLSASGDQLIATFSEEPCASVSAAIAADSGMDRKKRKTSC